MWEGSGGERNWSTTTREKSTNVVACDGRGVSTSSIAEDEVMHAPSKTIRRHVSSTIQCENKYRRKTVRRVPVGEQGVGLLEKLTSVIAHVGDELRPVTCWCRVGNTAGGSGGDCWEVDSGENNTGETEHEVDGEERLLNDEKVSSKLRRGRERRRNAPNRKISPSTPSNSATSRHAEEGESPPTPSAPLRGVRTHSWAPMACSTVLFRCCKPARRPC